MKKAIGSVLLICTWGAIVCAQDIIISKPPDIGPWWAPLGGSGTDVYADSFVMPAGGETVGNLGIWLMEAATDGSANPEANTARDVPKRSDVSKRQNGPEIRLQIWGGGVAGPDCNQVLATTEYFSVHPLTLELFVMPLVSNVTLTAGETYWLVATNVGGDPGLFSYQTGGHTQNSVYPDNGTFWYANDPTGCNFDGQALTTEMAFQVLAPAIMIPTLGQVGLVVFGILLATAALVYSRRTRMARQT